MQSRRNGNLQLKWTTAWKTNGTVNLCKYTLLSFMHSCRENYDIFQMEYNVSLAVCIDHHKIFKPNVNFRLSSHLLWPFSDLTLNKSSNNLCTYRSAVYLIAPPYLMPVWWTPLCHRTALMLKIMSRLALKVSLL